MHQASCSSLLSASRHCGQTKKEPQFPSSGSLHISPSWRQASGQTVEFDVKESMVGWRRVGWRVAETQLEREAGKDHVGEVGWMVGRPVGKLLKYVEPLDENSSSSFSSFTPSFPRTSSSSFPTLALFLLIFGFLWWPQHPDNRETGYSNVLTSLLQTSEGWNTPNYSLHGFTIKT